MSALDYDALRAHVRHAIACVAEGPDEAPRNVAVKCLTCQEVLLDCDAPEEEETEEPRVPTFLADPGRHRARLSWAEARVTGISWDDARIRGAVPEGRVRPVGPARLRMDLPAYRRALPLSEFTRYVAATLAEACPALYWTELQVTVVGYRCTECDQEVIIPPAEAATALQGGVR